jgi:hypothetical protein
MEDKNRKNWKLKNKLGTKNEVWRHFRIYEKEFPGAVCIHCYEQKKDGDPTAWEVLYGNIKVSTSKLSQHLRTQHRSIYMNENIERIKGPMDEHVTEGQKHIFNIMEFVVQCYQPLSICDHISFRKLIGNNSISSKKILDNLLLQYCFVKENIKKTLKDQHVALTSDTWTSDANESYCSLTAHWITPTWQLKSACLNCTIFPGEHKKQDLLNKILAMTTEFELPHSKISCLLGDNEPTNNAMADNLPFQWNGCFNHLLELVTSSIIKEDTISDLLANCRALVGEIKKSPKAEEELRTYQVQLLNIPKEKTLTVIQDVATRWWSTWSMLDRLCDLKRYIQLHSLKHHLSEQCWGKVDQIRKILEPFMKVQKMMEAEKSITISFIPMFVCRLRNGLLSSLREYANQPEIHGLLTLMNKAFENRWGKGNNVVEEHETRGPRNIRKGLSKECMIAAAVDPRSKQLFGIPVIEQHKIWTIIRTEILASINDPTLQVDLASSTSSSDIEDESLVPFFESPSVSKRQRITHSAEEIHIQTIDQELEHYRSMPDLESCAASPGDPLRWWKENSNALPNLSKLARKYLAIPATSAPSERLFSVAGLTISEQRSTLRPDNAETLIFLKQNWSLAQPL